MINGQLLDDNDIASYVEKDNFEAFLMKKQFIELGKMLNLENEGKVFITEPFELDYGEQILKKRKELLCRVKREKMVKMRRGVPVTTLGGNLI